MIAFDRRKFGQIIISAGLFSAVPKINQSHAFTADKTSSYPPIIGREQTYKTRYKDSLVDLARKFGLGYTEIVSANPGVDPWVPGANKQIVLPTAHVLPNGPREGILINLADQRMYLFHPNGKTVDTAPLGIGNEGWDTPKGSTRVVGKKKNPTWYVPKSVRKEQPELPAIIPPGPDNPLGSHAVYLGWPAYLFHGTNKPYGVGRRVSHGCVRLYPEDIARIFDDVEIGTKVTVIDQPLKITRLNDELWIEVHPNQIQSDEVERTGRHTYAKPPEFEFRLVNTAGELAHSIDWKLAKRAVSERRGTPIQILTKNTEGPRNYPGAPEKL